MAGEQTVAGATSTPPNISRDSAGAGMMSAEPAGARGFVPALEGLRAGAALGVMLTHVAFQTGAVDGSLTGRVWGRLDMAVAVFFGLSGFLMWRAHARAAHRGPDATFPPRPRAAQYYRSRIVRLLPAYLVVAVVVLTLIPDARAADLITTAANLSITQVFVPFGLVEGLTQMWSLSVEVSYYAVVPVLGVLLWRLRGPRAARLRVPLILAAIVVSWSWAWVGALLPLADGVNTENWLPGYVGWFGAGMILAEVVVAAPERFRALRRVGGRRWVMWPLAAVAFAGCVAPIAGPVGLESPTHAQYATRMAFGAVMAFALLSPLVLAPRGTHHRVLGSRFMQAIGRWSYGIFLWHLVVLAGVFPLLGLGLFQGHFVLVAAVTAVCSTAVAAVSYGVVEEPLRAFDARRRASISPRNPTRPRDPT